MYSNWSTMGLRTFLVTALDLSKREIGDNLLFCSSLKMLRLVPEKSKERNSWRHRPASEVVSEVFGCMYQRTNCSQIPSSSGFIPQECLIWSNEFHLRSLSQKYHVWKWRWKSICLGELATSFFGKMLWYRCWNLELLSYLWKQNCKL